MKKTVLALASSSAIMLAACETPQQQDLLVGALAGAAIGSITAKILTNDPEWIVLGALAGAAAGTLVAQNSAKNECAYAVGDGTYRVYPC